jgi:hypothetical protein
MTPYAFCWRLSWYADMHPEDIAATMWHLVMALVRVNVAYLRAHPRTPSILNSGIYYRRDTEAVELQWYDIPAIIEVGYADCKALAAWAIAEALVRGMHAEPDIIVSGRAQVHVRARINGRIVDPSRVLGMV